jgi:hypothetical protein
MTKSIRNQGKNKAKRDKKKESLTPSDSELQASKHLKLSDDM